MSMSNKSDAAILADRFRDLLACSCGAPLTLKESGDEFQCSTCDETFRVEDGILGSTSPAATANDLEELMQQEERQRDIQATRYDKVILTSLPSWFEARRLRRALATLQASSVLEIGCGTGRFTGDIAQMGDRLVAVDRSMASLKVCRKKLIALGFADRVLLIRADVNAMPLRKEAFDVAVTAQMIQHLPSPELRNSAISNLAAALKPDGQLVITVYQWRDREPSWRTKEGLHPGGIYFFRFTEADLRALLSPSFDISRLDSSLGKLFLACGSVKSNAKPEAAEDSPAVGSTIN